MSQRLLASVCQVTPQSVSQWESGASEPSADMLIKLSKAFGVSCDYLLGCEEMGYYIRTDSLNDSQAQLIFAMIREFEEANLRL